MSIPQPFPYQGSKRKIADTIIAQLPGDVDTLIEPFAGSAAISVAAAYQAKAQHFVLNDVNAPLMALWQEIINQPDGLATQYEHLWTAQKGREKDYYFTIRDEFNRTRQPHYLLYLLARCVKASIRYNTEGDFNQSPDNRRRGMHPATMRRNILATAQLLKGKTTVHALDYREIIYKARPLDVIYMDPPYQGVCKKQDPRYLQSLSFESFVESLRALNLKDISYIVSYDGRTGTKTYGKALPTSLDLRHLELEVGRSSQETLLGRTEITFESLYLSPALCARLEGRPAPLRQMGLWA
jgi:DNA adenine methylase